MAMIKNSNEHIPCVHCDRDAVPGTDPPVCEEHMKLKKKASAADAETLKELLNA